MTVISIIEYENGETIIEINAKKASTKVRYEFDSLEEAIEELPCLKELDI